VWSYRFIYGPNQALWAHIWAENGPETPENATGFGSARPEQEILSETLNTPRLAQNAHFLPL
jgi:hypothetical protein